LFSNVSSVLNIKTRQTLKGKEIPFLLLSMPCNLFFLLCLVIFYSSSTQLSIKYVLCSLGDFILVLLSWVSHDAQEVSDKIMLEFSCVHLFSSMYFFKHFHFIHLILHLFVQFACPLFPVVSQSCIFFFFCFLFLCST